MPVCGKTKLSRSALLAWLALLLLFALPQSARATGFFVLNARSELSANVYTLTASIRYQLTPEVVSALKNGIPVVIEFNIEVVESRPWYRVSDTIAELKQQYRVQYQALAQRFLVTNVNSGVQDYFNSMDEAISSLSAISDLPILDASLLQKDMQYFVRVRAGLNYDGLPAPLRYYAFALPEWRLDSEWYNFPL